jgi:hypothetical protein
MSCLEAENYKTAQSWNGVTLFLSNTDSLLEQLIHAVPNDQ